MYFHPAPWLTPSILEEEDMTLDADAIISNASDSRHATNTLRHIQRFTAGYSESRHSRVWRYSCFSRRHRKQVRSLMKSSLIFQKKATGFGHKSLEIYLAKGHPGPGSLEKEAGSLSELHQILLTKVDQPQQGHPVIKGTIESTHGPLR
jgi:hypothetical protein